MVVTKHEDRGKYFHCKKDRHRRRNYPNYLDYLKSKKTKPSEDMSTWIIDISASTHICNNL